MKLNTKEPALPAPVTKSDITRPSYETMDQMAREDYNAPCYTAYGGTIEFEIWYTERFGWVIPTLTIANVSARQRSRGAELRRTYAVTVGRNEHPSVASGQLVRVGLGPHVLAHYTVYVRKDRLEALTPLLDTMLDGSAKAGDCRDRISTRRAQTALRRRSTAYDFLDQFR